MSDLSLLSYGGKPLCHNLPLIDILRGRLIGGCLEGCKNEAGSQHFSA